jgi:hypothetical protein
MLVFFAALMTPALSARGDVKPPPRRATLRVLERSAPVALVGLAVDSFRIEKRIDPARSESSPANAGVVETAFSAKLHTESAAEEDRLFETLSLALAIDPLVGRPPLVEIAIGSRSYQGVVTSVVTDCDGARCRAELTMRPADRAATPRAGELSSRDLGF